MEIVLPKRHVGPENIGLEPFFFLGGPIRGGDDWQAKACLLLKDLMAKDFDFFRVVVPCRWDKDHPLTKYFATHLDNSQFSRQTSWERSCLSIAGESAQQGCIIFWLPNQSAANPRPPEDGPYARETYGELGEWRGRMMANSKIRLVVGAEQGFPGLSQIKHNFECALQREFPIHNTLEETVKWGVATAFGFTNIDHL